MFLIKFLIILSVVRKSLSQSPCPEYFRYESDGVSNYGMLEVPPIQLGMNLKIVVQLSINTQFQNVSHNTHFVCEITNYVCVLE